MRVDDIRIPVTVVSRSTPAAGVVQLELGSASGSALPRWSPGAHIDLHLPGDRVRQYSLCGDGDCETTWRVAVLRAEPGRGGSRFIHDGLEVGAPILASAPRNHFPFVPGPRVLFIAGGIGITPLIPMIAAAEATGADWQLWYGGRTRASMAYAAELAARHGARAHIWPEDQEGPLPLDRLLGTPEADTAIYCCGPAGLLDRAAALAAAWPAGAFHMERFAPADPAGLAAPRPFALRLAQSGRVLSVGADQTVLQVLEAAGVDILCSCREGTCGTCEVAVVGGVVDHRDSVLFPEEQAANNVMMACVSRALSDELVLDL